MTPNVDVKFPLSPLNNHCNPCGRPPCATNAPQKAHFASLHSTPGIVLPEDGDLENQVHHLSWQIQQLDAPGISLHGSVPTFNPHLASLVSESQPTSLLASNQSFVQAKLRGSTLYCASGRPEVALNFNMRRTRRSLQSILIPPFFHPSSEDQPTSSTSPSTSSRARSLSSASQTRHVDLPPAIPINRTPESLSDTGAGSSPPSDLLDSDPFANLSQSPSIVSVTEPSSRRHRVLSIGARSPESARVPPPRSPLAQSVSQADLLPHTSSFTSLSTLPSTPPVSRRPTSSGQGQVQPAYTRPAFTRGPSLPSLHTLSQMNVVIPKVKRGRVGAHLPSEPWDAPPTNDLAQGPGIHDQSRPQASSHLRSSYALSTIRDSRLITEAETLSPEECFDDQEQRPSSMLGADLLTPSVDAPTDPDHCATGSNTTMSYALQTTRTQSEPVPFERGHLHPTAPSSDRYGRIARSATAPSSLYEHHRTARISDSSVFSPHASSIYSHIPTPLDYEYSEALAHLDAPSPTASRHADQLPLYDFEPGTSADTIRSPAMKDEPRSPTAQWTLGLGTLSLSPTSTLSSDESSGHSRSITTSASSSDYEYDDGGDFLSLSSDSSEEEATSPPHSGRSDLTATREQNGQRSFSPTATPYPSMYYENDDDLSFESEQETEADRTETPSGMYQAIEADSRIAGATEELVDGGENSSRRSDADRYNTGSSAHRSTGGTRTGGASGGGSGWSGGSGSYGSGSGGHGGRDDGDRWNRRPPGRTAMPEETSDEEDSTDDYGEDSPTHRGKPSQTPQRLVDDTSNTDDDVPLARQIPTALKAQRTIRRQVRDEIDQRRKDRNARSQVDPTDRRDSSARLPVPFDTRSGATDVSASSASHPTSSTMRPIGRPRTKTLPSKPSSPFSVSHLTSKLLGLQSSGTPPAAVSHRPSREALPRVSQTVQRDAPRGVSPTQGRFFGQPSPAKVPAPETVTPGGSRLRHARSFRRPRTTTGEDEHASPPLPASANVAVGRSMTTTRRRPHEEFPAFQTPPNVRPSSRDGSAGLDRARSTTRSASRRPSVDRERPQRPSGDQVLARPPMPPLPSTEAVATFSPPSSILPKLAIWQQRVFITNLQEYQQVEVSSLTTAGDILRILEGEGRLADSQGRGGWMLWEVSQDFGMERPVRSFEVISDVSSSWMSDRTVNVFMAKKTSLAPILSRTAIPTSSPVCSGFVQWEQKRGKWQKRWMELREHSLWLSKRDNGKDEVFLCSLSNFDAYLVTRSHKAPKAYVFAVKSTDSLSFFENTADYVHTFSCGEKDGADWLQRILLARSYVLHQDRNVLSTTGAALSRTGTRKHQRPAQPLVNLVGQTAALPSADVPPVPPPVFEPGSLLAKRAV